MTLTDKPTLAAPSALMAKVNSMPASARHGTQCPSRASRKYGKRGSGERTSPAAQVRATANTVYTAQAGKLMQSMASRTRAVHGNDAARAGHAARQDSRTSPRRDRTL